MFPQCDMCVPQKSLNSRHLTTAFYRQGMERMWRRLDEGKARVGTEGSLTAYGPPLNQVTSFKYLGQVLVEEYDGWLVMVCKLRRDRQKWAWVIRVFSR